MTPPSLLTPDELRELAALATRVRGRAGESVGTATSQRVGRGFELHALDPYRPGDDARSIDWRARLRTGELWVRRHRAEGDGGVRIVVDDSASMTDGKRALAARLAAALAVVAGAAQLPLAIDGLGGAGRGGAERARLDPQAAPRALARLGGLAGSGRGSLPHALDRARRAVRTDEQVVVISDLADPAPPDELAAALARLGPRVTCVFVIDAADARVPADASELVALEEDARRPLDDALAAGFEARVRGWWHDVEIALRHRGVAVVVVDVARRPRLADAAAELVTRWS